MPIAIGSLARLVSTACLWQSLNAGLGALHGSINLHIPLVSVQSTFVKCSDIYYSLETIYFLQWLEFKRQCY